MQSRTETFNGAARNIMCLTDFKQVHEASGEFTVKENDSKPSVHAFRPNRTRTARTHLTQITLWKCQNLPPTNHFISFLLASLCSHDVLTYVNSCPIYYSAWSQSKQQFQCRNCVAVRYVEVDLNCVDLCVEFYSLKNLYEQKTNSLQYMNQFQGSTWRLCE